MLSRVAERMYWAGRYLERAENSARLVDSYDNLLLDLPPDAGVDWRRLLQIADAEQEFEQRGEAPTERNILGFLLSDVDNPGSLYSSLAFVRENVRTSRDLIPREAWECVNELYLMARRRLSKAIGRPNRHEIMSACIVGCQQLTGLLSGTMSHGEAYNFLRLGVHLERADMSSRVVDVAALTLMDSEASEAYENTLWMGVLKSLSAYQMYRQHVRRRIAPADVVEFLIKDKQFPRAIAAVLMALHDSTGSLPRNTAVAAALAKLEQSIATAEVGSKGAGPLHDYIDRLQIGLADLHRAIEAAWFLTPNRS